MGESVHVSKFKGTEVSELDLDLWLWGEGAIRRE